jgi:DNA replication protein DnaD
MISGAPWYVSNQTLHEDLKILLIQDMIKTNINKYKNRRSVHENQLIKNLFTQTLRKKTQENLARRPS